MRYLLFFIIAGLTGVPFLLMGQKGPGGIGNTNGSSDLSFWIKADKGVTSSSGDISQWNDQSGNGHHVSQAQSSQKPTLSTNALNGNPVVSFNSSVNQYLESSSFTSRREEFYTVFFVTLPDGNQEQGSSILASNNNTNGSNVQIGFRNNRNGLDSLVIFGDSSNTYGFDIIGRNPEWRIWAGMRTATFFGNKAFRVWRDENELFGTNVNDTSMAKKFRLFRIGRNRDDNNPHYLNGKIAELALFYDDLTSVERIIVSNYLSAKYNISLSTNDKYSEQSGYLHNVAGIGNDGTTKHSVSNSGGMIIEEDNNTMGSGEYVFAGHNGMSGTSAQDLPTGVQLRWKRIWHLEKFGSTAVDLLLKFDFSDAGFSINPAGAAGNYELLYRSGTGGNFSTITATNRYLISPDQVVFAVSNANFSDGYYTIGSVDTASSPLPVELIRFEGHREMNRVRLEWETASETNNHYFEVQRSLNGENFQSIGKVPGNGTTVIPHVYSWNDTKPRQGVNYYRLKQVDYDGAYMFTSLIAVKFDGDSRGSLEVYPNPVQDRLQLKVNNIEYDRYQPVNVTIQTMSGNTLMKRSYQTPLDDIDLNTGNLEPGLYLIKFLTQRDVYTKKFIKQ